MWLAGMKPSDKATRLVLEALVYAAKATLVHLHTETYDWHDDAVQTLEEQATLGRDEFDAVVDCLNKSENSVTARVDYGDYCVSATLDGGLENVYVSVFMHVDEDEVVTVARKKFPYYVDRS